MDTAQLQALSRQGQINAIFEEISSPVQQFYSGANVLITGGSGFLGKQLLEKLLRSCNVNKVFLLLRSKKGTSVIERLQQLQLDPFTYISLHRHQFPAKVWLFLTKPIEYLEPVSRRLIQDWPNTYTFTKAIAEDVVRKAGADLPICVVRPAIVFCSYNEPDPGWLDQSCVYGPTGVFYGYVIGVIRTFLVDVNVGLGLVPVDYVNNAIIASAWDSSLRRGGEKVPIYTIANEESSISWKFICRVINTDEFRRTISSQALWYTYILPTNNKRYFQVLSWLLHYIPAYIVDAMASVFRIQRPKKIPSLVKVYKNVEKSRTIYEHFLTKAFHFQDQNVKGMLSRMSDKDRTIFNCDLANVNKKELIKRMSLGLRKYVVQEDLSTCNKACRKQFYFKIGNYGFLALYIYIFWILIKRIPKLSLIRYVKKFCK